VTLLARTSEALAKPRRRRVRPCLADPSRPRTWADVSKHGRVRHDAERGWHIDFRTVVWPGSDVPRRIRISKAPQYGKFASEREAERCLNTIRDRAINRPLHDVLAEYLVVELPENTVIHRWEHDFVPSKERQQQRGELSKQRLREFQLLPQRGYLGFWDGRSVTEVSTAACFRWREWLGKEFPHLAPKTLKNLFGDFRVFVGYLHLVGAIVDLPTLPVIKLPERARRVPDAVSLTRILAEIPEEVRGLWIARALAGLRPAEARRLNRSAYADGALVIDADVAKTKKARTLLIGSVVPELDAWIRAHRLDAKPWEPLFQNPNSWMPVKRWQATAERTVWIAALEAAGVEHVPPNQGGRHAFATHEIANGTDPYAVKDWMGHSSINVTQNYVSVSAVTLARRMRPRESGPAADRTRKEDGNRE
jgi:integrase